MRSFKIDRLMAHDRSPFDLWKDLRNLVEMVFVQCFYHNGSRRLQHDGSIPIFLTSFCGWYHKLCRFSIFEVELGDLPRFKI